MPSNLTDISITCTLAEDSKGDRLDKALSAVISDYSRAVLQSWIESGAVSVDGIVITKVRHKVSGGEHVTIVAALKDQLDWHSPEAGELDIVFEDDEMLVLNKPADCVVHPGAGNPSGTLVNFLLHARPQLSAVPRAGIIHRLDKDTSGLLIVAKTLKAHHYLVDSLQARHIHRQYRCIVLGEVRHNKTVEAPIGRHPTQRLKMAVVRSGKFARTHIKPIQTKQGMTECQVVLDTGRTHQIRVHMAHLKMPIIGDPLYGGQRLLPKNTDLKVRETIHEFKRQALHAEQLCFEDLSGQSHTVEAPFPADYAALRRILFEA